MGRRQTDRAGTRLPWPHILKLPDRFYAELAERYDANSGVEAVDFTQKV